MDLLTQGGDKTSKNLVPFQKLGIFFGYSFFGLAGIGYFTYKTFLNRHQNVYDKHAKKFIRGSPLFKNIAKTIGWTGFFFITAGFLVKYIKPTQLVVSQALKIDRQYQNHIKIDPVFQNYYIFQTMNYFGISQKLIKKTQEQLKQIKKNMKQSQSQSKLPQQQMQMEKQLMRMVLARQNFEKLETQIQEKKLTTAIGQKQEKEKVSNNINK